MELWGNFQPKWVGVSFNNYSWSIKIIFLIRMGGINFFLSSRSGLPDNHAVCSLQVGTTEAGAGWSYVLSQETTPS